jgi:hypothetical protein
MPAKARLARKLLDETAKNRSDPVGFYVLTSESIRLASEAEAYDVLLEGIDLLASTYTGIEAVSNGLQMMREPRVATGGREITGENPEAGALACPVGAEQSQHFAVVELEGQAVQHATRAVVVGQIGSGEHRPGAVAGPGRNRIRKHQR